MTITQMDEMVKKVESGNESLIRSSCKMRPRASTAEIVERCFVIRAFRSRIEIGEYDFIGASFKMSA